MVRSPPPLGASVVDSGSKGPERFSCPFRYRATKNGLKYPESEPCKEGKQFPNISKLREHLKRVHSPEYRCQDCDHKFSQVSVAELQDLKDSHKLKCRKSGRKELPNFEMSQEQWEKCKNWTQTKVDRGSTNGLSERKPSWSWRKIYNSLFPCERGTVGPDVFGPKHGPKGHPRPSKGAGAGNGGLGGSATAMTGSEFVSSFSLDFKASNKVSGLSGPCWLTSDPAGPSSITASLTSGTTETVESASTHSDRPTSSTFESIPLRLMDDVYMGSESDKWGLSPDMDFLKELGGGMPAHFGSVDEQMDGQVLN